MTRKLLSLLVLLMMAAAGAWADGLNLSCTVPITADGESSASCDGGSVHAVGRKVYVSPINSNFDVNVWEDNINITDFYDPTGGYYNAPQAPGIVTVNFRLRTQNVVVSFDMNGLEGTAPADQSRTLGQQVEKPQDPTTPEDTDFIGWFMDKSNPRFFDFNAPLDHTLPYTYKSSDNKFHLTLYAAYRFLVNSGTCGKEDETHDGSQLTWELYKSSDTGDADYLVISGNGEMADDLSDNWKQVKTAIIEDGVTTIGQAAFYFCKGLTLVSFPASLTTIGQGAFYGCTGLTSVSLPTSLTTIGEGAFIACTGLKSVYFPASLTTISQGAFLDCSSLASLSLPASLTTIGQDAFRACTGLTSVSFPTSLTTIGEGAFSGCWALASMSIPASVTTIGVHAFYGCTGLQSVTLNSNPFIGDGAFYGVGSVTMNLTANAGGDAYWMTFYNKHYGFTVADATNTQVFTATLSGDQLTLNPVEGGVIPADNPVILKSASANLMLTKNQQTSTLSNNSLQGTTATITNPGNAYVLNKKEAGIGFYKLSTGGTIGVGKAYLVYPAGAREFFSFNEETSINEELRVKNEEFATPVYDLQGRRVSPLTSPLVEEPSPLKKGLYIVNGKKVVIK